MTQEEIDRIRILGPSLADDFHSLSVKEQSILLRNHDLNLETAGLLTVTNITAAMLLTAAERAIQPIAAQAQLIRAVEIEHRVRQRLAEKALLDPCNDPASISDATAAE